MGKSNVIEKINKEIENPRTEFDTLEGYEVVLEALIYKIYDLFGRNALLSMTYQIGAGPGEEIAKRILKERGVDKILDPFDAMEILLNENKRFYSVQVRDVKVEPYKDEYYKIYIEISNRCFYRESLKKRPRLRIGGPLCRINKGYYEVAFKKLTGLKNEINFIRNDEENNQCIESVTFYIPKDMDFREKEDLLNES
ncbi:MAG: hypothetical protein ACTSU2_14070 [Promethearchaeota archaeon]